MPSTSKAISQTVLSQPATFKVSAVTPTLAFAAGATSGNTSWLNITPTLGFLGGVNLMCAVSYSGGGSVNAPTCAMNSSSISINLNTAAGLSLLTINSVARPVASSQLYHWKHPGAVAICALMVWLAPVRRRRWQAWTGVIVLLLGLTALSGCGGNGSSTSSAPVATTPGSYTVTITGTTTVAGIAPPAPATIALTIN